MTGMAFQITTDDIENVLSRLNVKASKEDVKKVFNLLDGDSWRVEKAALNGGTELEEQTESAYDEIEQVLRERKLVSDGKLLIK